MSNKCLVIFVLLLANSEAFAVEDNDIVARRQGTQSLLKVRDNLSLLLQQQQSVEDSIACKYLWFIQRNGTCQCGDDIYGVVTCNEHTKTVMILDCYCMTPEAVTQKMVVGDCFYNCVNMTKNADYQDYMYHHVPSNCTYLHRTGTLCGQCDYSNNYYPPAYSYDMGCIECDPQNSWWQYITVAFLPLTIFIVVILVFRISVVSPKLRAFVCFSQIFAAPIELRIISLSTKYTLPIVSIITNILSSAYSVWNLDFFRTLLPGICLKLTTLQVLALDYLIAVYPMVLMVIFYILIELHEHGFRPILFIWKPFHLFFARFRREWNIQTSLIDAFVTFFILSTTKLFSVSFDLLIPTILYLDSGDIMGVYLYYDANIKYMRGEHLHYALLALTVLLLFSVLPLSLIILSTCSCIRNRIRLRVRVIQDFLNTFQKYYKDGSNGTRDCRWFAGYYILSLFGAYLLYAFTLNGYMYNISIVYCIIFAIIVLIVEPYKEDYAMYNILDTLLFLWQALFGVSISLVNMASLLQRKYLVFGYFVVTCVSLVPLILISAMVIKWILKRTRCFRDRRTTDLSGSLAHRITNSNEYKDNCGYVTLNSQQLLSSTLAEDTHHP